MYNEIILVNEGQENLKHVKLLMKNYIMLNKYHKIQVHRFNY